MRTPKAIHMRKQRLNNMRERAVGFSSTETGDVASLDIRVRRGIGRWQEDVDTAHIIGPDRPPGSDFIVIIIIIITIINVISINNLITYRT